MSAGPQAGRPRRAVSWLGLVAIGGGLALIRLYFHYPRLATNPNPLVGVVYLGTGGVLMLWGLRALGGELHSAIFRGRMMAGPRYRTRMPPEALFYFVILVVLLLGALLGHSNMMMLVFGLTAGPFIVNGQITLAVLKRLHVARRLPAHATVGENSPVTLCLSNGKRFLSSWMVVAEDFVQAAGEQLQPAVLFTHVPARSERSGIYDICPARRGLYEFGPVRLLSRFPMGLMERSVELGPVERLLVYPRLGRLRSEWWQAGDAGKAISERARVLLGGSDDEFHRLREYRGGDNPRSIHWRTTARRSALMVREYQHQQRPRLLLIVDLWLPAQPQPEDLERVELAVSFAASACVEQVQAAADSGVDLVVCGRQSSQASGMAGGRAIAALLEMLAVAQAGSADGLEAAVREATRQAPPHARRVLITTRRRADPRSAALAAVAAGQSSGGSKLEIVEADPKLLMEYLEFDDHQAAGGRLG